MFAFSSYTPTAREIAGAIVWAGKVCGELRTRLELVGPVNVYTTPHLIGFTHRTELKAATGLLFMVGLTALADVRVICFDRKGQGLGEWLLPCNSEPQGAACQQVVSAFIDQTVDEVDAT